MKRGFPFVERGMVLTANQRLAAHLVAAHDRVQLDLGKTAWQPPDILSLDAWLGRCRESCWPEAPALTGHQSQLLWEAVIGDVGLLNTAAAAAHAAKAWQLMADWQVRLDVDDPGLSADLSPEFSEDVRAFLGWADVYKARLKATGWSDGAARLSPVPEWIESGLIALPKTVCFAGFDREPPALRTVMAAMQKRGVQVNRWAGPDLPSEQLKRLVAEDMEAEAELAARWARARLAEGGRVAIVVPDLASYRPTLERALTAQLCPGAVAGAGDPVAVNFSLGDALSAQPVVAGALSLLAVGQRPTPVGQLIALLNGPWLGGGERDGRALAAARIGAKRRGELTLNGFSGALQRAARRVANTPNRHSDDLSADKLPNDTAPLAATVALIKRWDGAVTAASEKRPPSDWARHFASLLGTLGWPGDLPQDSRAHQAASRWTSLLAEFAGFDLVSGPMARGEAVSRLATLAGATVFQPQGPRQAVQVMGVLEAAGMGFDHLWLMGFRDDVWPSSPSPTPFLPVALQRRMGMPRADAGAELAYARTITGRLLCAAPSTVVSSPAQVDGREVAVSPLLAHVALLPAESVESALALSDDLSHPRILAAWGDLQAFDDATGPPLADKAGQGGVSLFADQAACPFKAFAGHRLGARLDDPAGPGLDAADRGSLLHKALERVWIQLKTSTGLQQAAADDTLSSVVESAVGEAVDLICRDTGLSANFAAGEGRRVCKLLREWLNLELDRAPFTVLGTEQKGTAEAGGVEVNTTIDRIDQLPDGSEVLIDYKTGISSVNGWFGERPKAPQLPLYLTMRDAPVSALAFATVRRGESRFVGLGAKDDLLPKVDGIASAKRLPETVADSWQQVGNDWRQVLDRLGQSFAAGEAQVDPTDKGCDYCQLGPLCRIWEQNLGGDDDD